MGAGRAMRAIRAVVLAAALLTFPAAAQQRATFAVRGSNPDGSAYAGELEATQRPDGTWILAWHVAGSVVRGIGMVQGETFAAAFSTDGSEPGLATYRILPDGRLDGSWTTGRGIGREVLTPR
jgi:hypothetical protein